MKTATKPVHAFCSPSAHRTAARPAPGGCQAARPPCSCTTWWQHPPAPLVFLLLGPTQHVLGQAPEVAAPTTSGSRRCPACPPCHLPLRPCALWCLNSAGLCEQQIEIIGSMLQGAVAGLGMPFGEDPQGGPPFLQAIFAQHPATGRPFGASCAG